MCVTFIICRQIQNNSRRPASTCSPLVLVLVWQSTKSSLTTCRGGTSPRVLEATTVKVFDLCYRQREINFAVVVRTYVSQRGLIWKQRCRCSLSFLRSTTSINIAVIHSSCQTCAAAYPKKRESERGRRVGEVSVMSIKSFLYIFP